MSNAEVLQEELEVLESIFPDELESKSSPRPFVSDQADPYSLLQKSQMKNCAYEWTRSKRYQDRNVSGLYGFPSSRP